MPRASEGDVIELEGKIFKALKPNEGEYGWSQFVVLKDSTGDQGCWLNLEAEDEKVAKGSSIKLKGKVGKEYKNSQGKMTRSLNNCDFETDEKETTSTSVQSSGDAKEDYWAKKFEWDKKVQFIIVRECAIKAVTELAKVDPKNFTINVNTEHDYFRFANKIVDYIYSEYTKRALRGEITGTSENGTPEVETGTKKERIKKAEEAVGETRFRPASTKQKKIIFGYKDKEGYHKGMIDSRYIETHEIKKIGDPKKLSVEKASEWIEFWWGEEGNPDDIGARKQREIDNPRDENGKLVNALVKGDKTSLTKDILVDEIYALRRENRLNDDEKFKKEVGYNPKIEELTEAELTKLKNILKRYVPF